MRPIHFIQGINVIDGISLLQSHVAAQDLTLNGTLVVTGRVFAPDSNLTFTTYADLQTYQGITFPKAQYQVTINAVDDNSGTDFEIVGLDANGKEISETVTGPGAAASVFSVYSYAKILRISADDAVSQVSAGVNFIGASVCIPLDIYANPFSVTIGVEPASGGDVTVEYTLDDIFAADFGSDQFATWYAMSTLTNVTTNPASGTLIDPVRAIRFVVNTGSSSSVEGEVVQGGII